MFDLFKSAASATTPNTSTPPQNNSGDNSTKPPTVDSNGNIPAMTPVNPLDAYQKMYENANKDTLTAPNFSLDPKVVGEVSKTMDFTGGIDQVLLEKAMAGDPKAILAAIQASSRASYQAALEHTTALTDTHLKQRSDYDSRRINEGVRTQLTSNALTEAPNYSHPVVKAELNRVAEMMAKANPDASPQQIAAAAQKHLIDVSKALSPNQQTQEQQDNSAGFDYTKYLS